MVHEFPDPFRFEIIDGELLLSERIWEDEELGAP
jgi:hypothetical protein